MSNIDMIVNRKNMKVYQYNVDDFEQIYFVIIDWIVWTRHIFFSISCCLVVPNKRFFLLTISIGQFNCRAREKKRTWTFQTELNFKLLYVLRYETRQIHLIIYDTCLYSLPIKQSQPYRYAYTWNLMSLFLPLGIPSNNENIYSSDE